MSHHSPTRKQGDVKLGPNQAESRFAGQRLASRCALLVGITMAGLLAIRALADDAPEAAQPADGTAQGEAASPETEGQPADQPATDATTGEQTPAPAPVEQAPQLPLAIRPYRVLVSVGIPAEAPFDSRFRDLLLLRLREQISGQLASMWNADVELSPHVSSGGAEVLREKSAQLTALYETSGYDKVFWLSLQSSGSRFEVAAIEWDGTIRQPGAVFTQSTRDERRIDEALFEVMYDAFRPVAFVTEIVGPRSIVLTMRAGDLLHEDAPRAQFHERNYLGMTMRSLDRKFVVKEIREVPWTYVHIDNIDRARMEASVFSAFPNAIPELRKRVEVAGLLLKVTYDETILSVESRGTPPEPLIASPVDVMDRYPTEEDPVEDRIRLISDRLGEVAVPAFPDDPLRYLMVHSGDQVLGKVPMIPGVNERMHLEVPDDGPRLNVEGELSMMQGVLIDNVARSAVLMARAENAAEAGEWEEVDAFIAELDAIPPLDEVLNTIAAHERAGVADAQAMRDRTQEARINNMCEDLADLARRHIDPERRTQFDQRIGDMRSAAGLAM